MKRKLLVFILLFVVVGCGGNKSSIEGKLCDWNGKPVGRIQVTATQVKPMKGYEKLESKTNNEGTFHLKGLFPSSKYILKPSSDNWQCPTTVQIESAPKGETAILSKPIVISYAVSKSDGGLVQDLITGASRFSKSADGIITDSQTSLEWIVGPSHITHQSKAAQWVAKCSIGNGGWRMPNQQELKKLYFKGVGVLNIDPSFNINTKWVWAEARGQWVWYFNFGNGSSYQGSQIDTHRKERLPTCVLAVRRSLS